MKLRRTMKAQSPKKKEKERTNNNNKEKKKRISVRPEEGSRSGQRKCSKKKDFGQIRGYAARCMFIFPTKAIKKSAKPSIIFVTHGPSPWDPEWIVREKQFGWQGSDFW